MTQVDSHPAAIITGSPVVVGNVVYQGISSMEEALALDKSYACCTFRGSVVALDAATSKILWQQYTVPNNNGLTGNYSGGPIWQPPAIDSSLNLLYIGTGNNYTVPSSVETCRLNNPTDNSCDAANDYFDSALALNLSTGAIEWSRSLYGYDAWNAACEAGSDDPSRCPDPEGPDYDLSGSGPNIVGNIVGFSQKSGVYWALNASTGATEWSETIGPGRPAGRNSMGNGERWHQHLHRKRKFEQDFLQVDFRRRSYLGILECGRGIDRQDSLAGRGSDGRYYERGSDERCQRRGLRRIV